MNALGASLHAGGAAFRVWAPRCRSVDVVVDGRAPRPLKRPSVAPAGMAPDWHLLLDSADVRFGGPGAVERVAPLERLSGRSLLHAPPLERRLVEACVDAGAADGITRRREPTVDGLPVDVHAAVVELLGLASHAGRRGMMGRLDRGE